MQSSSKTTHSSIKQPGQRLRFAEDPLASCLAPIKPASSTACWWWGRVPSRPTVGRREPLLDQYLAAELPCMHHGHVAYCIQSQHRRARTCRRRRRRCRSSAGAAARMRAFLLRCACLVALARPLALQSCCHS